jgi:hypothetical protein
MKSPRSKRKNKKRQELGVHLGRKQRKSIRKKLVAAFGTKCCWCDEEMEIPAAGIDIKNMEDLATIEHHFAKEVFDSPDSIMHLRLAHKRCNK